MSSLSPKVCFHTSFHNRLCYELFVTNHAHEYQYPVKLQGTGAFRLKKLIENIYIADVIICSNILLFVLISLRWNSFFLPLHSYALFDLYASSVAGLSDDGSRLVFFSQFFFHFFCIAPVILASLNSSSPYVYIFIYILIVDFVKNFLSQNTHVQIKSCAIDICGTSKDFCS